jgi:hypothetical protein
VNQQSPKPIDEQGLAVERVVTSLQGNGERIRRLVSEYWSSSNQKAEIEQVKRLADARKDLEEQLDAALEEWSGSKME